MVTRYKIQTAITTASRFYPVKDGMVPTTSPATWNQDANDFVYAQFASTAVTYTKWHIGLDDLNTTAFKITPIFTNPSSAGNASFMFDGTWDGITWGATVGSITTLSTTATSQQGTQTASLTPGGTRQTTCIVRATRIATSDTIAALVNLTGVWVQWGVTRV
jgi:FlaG/FlaF family flagellin (archaellin)